MVLPLIGAIASIGSALIGANAAQQAGNAQADATRYASDIQRQNFQDSSALLQPQITAGNTARSRQLGLLGLPGGEDPAQAVNFVRSSPGYQFGLKTGTNQVQTSAAAGGRLFSGKTLKDLTRFGSDYADSKMGGYFNQLGGLSGAGAGAVGQQVNLGTQTAGNLGDLAVQGGNARASSYVGGANAMQGGIQNLANLANYYMPQKQNFGGVTVGNGWFQ